MSALPLRRNQVEVLAGAAPTPSGKEVEVSEPAWVETPTSTKIMAALEFARTTPTIAIVFGAAGCSKTTAARHYAEGRKWGKGSAYYVCAGRFNRSPTAILHLIAEAVGDYVGGYRNDTIARSVLERVSERSLFIIDEAQHLDADALDGVRYFFDAGKVGIAYLGNEEVYTRISRKGRRAAFAQLHSRVGMRLHVQRPTDEDVDAVLAAWGIRGRRERDYALQIASQPGGLRTLSQVLRQASIYAAETKRTVDRGILSAAAEMLGLVD
jgi:hypothetical protein